jgi:hypothetical protein
MANADLVIVCSYPLSSVDLVLAANELILKPKMFGGGMVGLQGIAVKSKLGPKLNGIINYETRVPSEKMMAPAAEFFKKYQARAAAEGADPLGYYLGGWGNAYISVLGKRSVVPSTASTSKKTILPTSAQLETCMTSDESYCRAWVSKNPTPFRSKRPSS